MMATIRRHAKLLFLASIPDALLGLFGEFRWKVDIGSNLLRCEPAPELRQQLQLPLFRDFLSRWIRPCREGKTTDQYILIWNAGYLPLKLQTLAAFAIHDQTSASGETAAEGTRLFNESSQLAGRLSCAPFLPRGRLFE